MPLAFFTVVPASTLFFGRYLALGRADLLPARRRPAASARLAGWARTAPLGVALIAAVVVAGAAERLDRLDTMRGLRLREAVAAVPTDAIVFSSTARRSPTDRRSCSTTTSRSSAELGVSRNCRVWTSASRRICFRVGEPRSRRFLAGRRRYGRVDLSRPRAPRRPRGPEGRRARRCPVSPTLLLSSDAWFAAADRASGGRDRSPDRVDAELAFRPLASPSSLAIDGA